ncbi:hypothetical protein DVH24_003250 [Malus domestica]|uniref:Uncharacterized protein n=1 Tax=Malus domestica TaxID=3750 RepID=A0A498IL97_MALDO|nr:hypothetical protein DVH24_003250 [Malus domestica]
MGKSEMKLLTAMNLSILSCRCPGQRYLFDWLLDKTILQPRDSRRQLLIHGSKGESLYSEICSNILIISAIF